MLLDLVEEVFFQHWVYLVVLPSEILVPEHKSVYVIVARPTRLVVLVVQAPLTNAWNVSFVSKFALKDQLRLRFGHRELRFTAVHFLFHDLADVHLLMNDLLIMLQESTFLRT